MRLSPHLLLSLALSCTLAACGDDGGGGSSTSNGTSSTSNGTSATSNGTSGTSNGSSSTSNGTSSTTGGYDFPEGIQGDNFTSGPGFEVRVCEARMGTADRWTYEYADNVVIMSLVRRSGSPEIVLKAYLYDGIPRQVIQTDPADPDWRHDTVLVWEELGGDNWVNLTDLYGEVESQGYFWPYLPYNGRIAQVWEKLDSDDRFYLVETSDFRAVMPDIEPPVDSGGSCLICTKDTGPYQCAQ